MYCLFTLSLSCGIVTHYSLTLCFTLQDFCGKPVQCENAVKAHLLGQRCSKFHLKHLMEMKEAGSFKPDWEKLGRFYVTTFKAAIKYQADLKTGKAGKPPAFYNQKVAALLACIPELINEFLAAFDSA